MAFDEKEGMLDAKFLKLIVKNGTTQVDRMIDMHQRLIEKADELLAQYPGAAGYHKQKEDAQKAPADDYRWKRFAEERAVKTKGKAR